MRKILDAISLIAEMTPGVLLILAGVGFIVGGTTGVLWS